MLSGHNRYGMAHTIAGKAKLQTRVRRIIGQLEGVERALEAEKGCSEILHLLAGARGAMNGLMGEVLSEHIDTHLGDDSSKAERRRAASDLRDVVRTYLK